MLRLTLPLPPSKNRSHHWVKIGKGWRRVPTKDMEKWWHHARVAGFTAMWDQQFECAVDGKVVVRFWCYWPDKRTHDAGNMIDPLLDGLNGVCYADDCQALPRAIDFELCRADPRLEVEVDRL